MSSGVRPCTRLQGLLLLLLLQHAAGQVVAKLPLWPLRPVMNKAVVSGGVPTCSCIVVPSFTGKAKICLDTSLHVRQTTGEAKDVRYHQELMSHGHKGHQTLQLLHCSNATPAAAAGQLLLAHSLAGAFSEGQQQCCPACPGCSQGPTPYSMPQSPDPLELAHQQHGLRQARTPAHDPNQRCDWHNTE